MSTFPPVPDRPTEPLQPRVPPFVEEPVPVLAAGVPGRSLVGEIGSLRTGLWLVGVLALAALAVSVYVLATSDSVNGHGRYASSARVSEISRRVDSLTAQVQSLRAGRTATTTTAAGSTAALGARVDSLERTVNTLSARPASADPTKAIAQLSGRIDTLAAQVSQLRQTPTTTTPTP